MSCIPYEEGQPIPPGMKVVKRSNPGTHPPDDDGPCDPNDGLPEFFMELVPDNGEVSPFMNLATAPVQHEYDPTDEGHMCC